MLSQYNGDSYIPAKSVPWRRVLTSADDLIHSQAQHLPDLLHLFPWTLKCNIHRHLKPHSSWTVKCSLEARSPIDICSVGILRSCFGKGLRIMATRRDFKLKTEVANNMVVEQRSYQTAKSCIVAILTTENFLREACCQ